MRIARKGYYSGDPEKVLKARVDHVLALGEYETFMYEYESVYTELNKKDKL